MRHRVLRTFANLRAGNSAPDQRVTVSVDAALLVAWPCVVGKSVTELWTATSEDDLALVAGKVQNLRVACAALNGRLVAAGSTFSFWRVLGRPSRRKGYVLGRELREGCLVASVGGGLCQVSNALYGAALDAGLEIVERHAHSQIVPGSRAERGRDATVFWNYVDLRFRHNQDFVILATLEQDSLRVHIRTAAPSKPAANCPRPSTSQAKSIAIVSGDGPNDCVRCEYTQCVEKIEASPATYQTAFLLDEVWPEYDQWVATLVKRGDLALVPLHGAKRGRKNYHWRSLQTPGLACQEHRWLTLYRSLASRLLPAQGGVRQKKLLALNMSFACAYARHIPTLARHLVVPVTLLADLWHLGVLGGRSYDVLMNRAPLRMLQDALDQAAALHPQSSTLADFRACVEQVCAEDSALRGARTVVTPHHGVADYVAAHYAVPVQRLAWDCKTPTELASLSGPRGKQVLFPASALGRKGAYEVREACRQLGLPLRVLGNAQEEPGFWHSLHVSAAVSAELFHDVACVVLPAFVEHRPRILLLALARGIPVVCSPQCGLAPDMPNVVTVKLGSVSDLVQALQVLVKPSPAPALPA